MDGGGKNRLPDRTGSEEMGGPANICLKHSAVSVGNENKESWLGFVHRGPREHS